MADKVPSRVFVVAVVVVAVSGFKVRLEIVTAPGLLVPSSDFAVLKEPPCNVRFAMVMSAVAFEITLPVIVVIEPVVLASE